MSISRFEALRRRYAGHREAQFDYEIQLTVKYGKLDRSWLSGAERNKLDRLSRAVDRAGEALFAHIQAISPHDWSYGVPVAWILTELTYEDAVRPVGEKLSVAPPLSYGATEAMV